MAKIHNTAIVDKTAILADTVEVGPYCLIGPNVKVAAGTVFGSHCIVHKDTAIGKNNIFTTSSSIGGDPQDLKYKGEQTFLEIGDNNTIREYVTINRATGKGNKTIIGSGNLFMTTSHVGHNSMIGSHNVIANSVALGGYIVIEDRAILGGLSGVHQFCRIGRLSIIGGYTKAVQDIPPYSMCDGNPARIYGLNKIGLGRAGISSKRQLLLKRASKVLFAEGLLLSNAIKKVEKSMELTEEIKHLLEFVKSSERGIAHWKKSAS